jgi:hypothetical protein
MNNKAIIRPLLLLLVGSVLMLSTCPSDIALVRTDLRIKSGQI